MEAAFVEEYLRQLARTTSGVAQDDYNVDVGLAGEAVRDCYRFLNLARRDYVADVLKAAPMRDYREDSLAHDFALYRQTGAGFVPDEVGAAPSRVFRGLVDRHFPELPLAYEGGALRRRRGV